MKIYYLKINMEIILLEKFKENEKNIKINYLNKKIKSLLFIFNEVISKKCYLIFFSYK